MSAHTRKLLTNDSIKVTVHGNLDTNFTIPYKDSRKLFDFLHSLQSYEEDDVLISADEVFKDIDKKHGKVGVTIRGLRVRDGLTQRDLSQKLNIHQSHISQIENGKRVVGKNLAHKLAKVFHTNYRLFL